MLYRYKFETKNPKYKIVLLEIDILVLAAYNYAQPTLFIGHNIQ